MPCLRFRAIPIRTFAEQSHTLCQGDGVLKRPVHEHIFGDVHFARNGGEQDIFFIFTLPLRNPTIHARKFRRYVDVCTHT